MKQKKQKNNTKAKKHIALWCAVGCLALAGTVGTITFGTLWFTNKNSGGGGSDTPTQENVRLNKTELELSVGESESLFAYVEPAGASQDVIWSCDDTNIATVTNGLVTAKAPGDATIIVKPINSDNIAMCAINVKPKPDPEPEPGNFETDEWSTVCYYADKGIDALHKAYAGNCQINTDFPGTLIGLERKVKINGLQHVVRVIDESVEEYGNKPFIKRAALTFQFEKIVSQHNKSALKTKWDDSSNHYYPGSDLYYFLNDEQSPNIQSVFELIKSENNDLANCIKPIWQKTTYCDDTGSMETWNDEVKLYEPSVANIFSGYGILQGY